jgi:hypothetical protein
VARKKASYIFVKSNSFVFDCQSQMVPYPQFIELTWHSRHPEQRFDFRSKNKKAMILVIIQGPNSKRIPGAKQTPSTLIPNSKGKIPKQMTRTVFTPVLISVKYQFTVTKSFRPFNVQPQGPNQFGAIVDPGVSGNDQAILPERHSLS